MIPASFRSPLLDRGAFRIFLSLRRVREDAAEQDTVRASILRDPFHRRLLLRLAFMRCLRAHPDSETEIRSAVIGSVSLCLSPLSSYSGDSSFVCVDVDRV